MPSLAELSNRQRATIITIRGEDDLTLRLMEMGLMDGETVEVIGRAPLGDPIEISIRGYRLSLRRLEAERIEVEAQGQ